MQAKAITHSMQQRAHAFLRRGVRTANARHVPTPSRGAQMVPAATSRNGSGAKTLLVHRQILSGRLARFESKRQPGLISKPPGATRGKPEKRSIGCRGDSRRHRHRHPDFIAMSSPRYAKRANDVSQSNAYRCSANPFCASCAFSWQSFFPLIPSLSPPSGARVIRSRAFRAAESLFCFFVAVPRDSIPFVVRMNFRAATAFRSQVHFQSLPTFATKLVQ